MPFLVQDKHLTGTSSRVLNLGRGLLSQTKAGSAQDLELCGLVLCVADGVLAELAGCRAFSGFADLAGQPAAPRSPAEPCVDVSRSRRERGQRGPWDPPAPHLPCAASSRAAGRWKKPQRGIIVVLGRRAGERLPWWPRGGTSGGPVQHTCPLCACWGRASSVITLIHLISLFCFPPHLSP